MSVCLFCTVSLMYVCATVLSQSPLLMNHQMHDSPPVSQTPPAGWSFPLWVPPPLKSAGRSPTVRETSWAIVFCTSCSMEVSVTLRGELTAFVFQRRLHKKAFDRAPREKRTVSKGHTAEIRWQTEASQLQSGILAYTGRRCLFFQIMLHCNSHCFADATQPLSPTPV